MSSENKDLTISVLVGSTPSKVYKAIKDVKSWWVGEIGGGADQVGSIFTYQYKDFHKSTQKVTELIPDQKVVWHVEDAELSFTKNKKEWEGTDLVFEIIAKGEKTEIKFTHWGLTPEFECYEACSGGWEFYITKSLKNFLENGKGLDPGF
jgi:hypothetical protein